VLKILHLRAFFDGLLENWSQRPHTFLTNVSIVALLILVIYAFYILQNFPNSADEYSYVFQAETFSEGRLWNTVHPEQEFFDFIHIASKEGKWVGRFPPGWPILLTTGFLLNIPLWLINPMLGVLSIWVLFMIVSHLHGRKAAVMSILLYASSSFFILNSASYFSHTSCCLFILLFVLFELKYLKSNMPLLALLAGAAIGYAFIIRYYTAFLCGLPFGLYLLMYKRERIIPALAWTLVGALPFFLFILYYNYQITGDPLLFVTQWMDPDEKLGFVKKYNLHKLIRYTRKHFLSFIIWTAPPLIALYAVGLWKSAKRGCLHFTDTIFIFLVLGYMLWYSYGGNQYGPRFYYEAYPFVILAVSGWVFNDRSMLFTSTIKGMMRVFVYGGLVASLLILPVISVYEYIKIYERRDLYRQVEEQNITSAIIFIRDATGVLDRMKPFDLTRNGITLDGDVLYALYREKGVERLTRYFPEKTFYLYEKEKRIARGKLIPLESKEVGQEAQPEPVS
jgi:hypothetical protein